MSSLISEHFNNIPDAQACAAQLIAAGTQFSFAYRDGGMLISYPDKREPATPRAGVPRDPNPPGRAA